LAKKHKEQIMYMAAATNPESQTFQRQGGSGYEPLYTDTPLQLQETMFTLHPSQYKLIFPQDFEGLLNRISERITAQVSDLTSSMLERIFSF
jgi:hypothetical protein